MWSSGTVSWIDLAVFLLSDVMLGIQESVLGGLDDSVVDHWWLSVYLLTSKLVSSGSVGWETVWKLHFWGVLGVWIVSSSYLSLAGGNDGVRQVIQEWDSGIGSSLTYTVGEFDPSSSDS